MSATSTIPSSIPSKIVAVVPAAGVGRRMGTDKPKQYLLICGKTVLEHTLEKLLKVPGLEKIVVALASDDNYWKSISVFEDSRIETVVGGGERSHSVLNCIEHVHSTMNTDEWENAWLMVHDVARPCVSLKDITRLMDAVAGHPIGGLLAQPVTDTIKQVNADQSVNKTIDRSRLWQAQTPQLFRSDALLQSLRNGIDQGLVITDESSAIELAGHSPTIVEGSRDNIKITQPSDLALAEFYLSRATK